MVSDLQGYLHPLYAQSFEELGSAIELPASKGWVIRRAVNGTPYFDAMGSYPIFACQDWSSLSKDIRGLKTEGISLSMVTDPFGHYSRNDLKGTFPDICFPFKEHFIVDLQKDPQSYVDSHHRRNVNKALKQVQVEIGSSPRLYLDEWCALYDVLIARHHITGITKFSRKIFEKQFDVPGIMACKANAEGQTVGMLLWYIQGNIAYYHLGAYSSQGYHLNASFALFWTIIGYFADMGLRWLSLGAGAGAHNDGTDGLTRFKRGWSTGTRPAYFCGRVLDQEKYQEALKASKNSALTSYFPAYRKGES